MQQSVRQLSCKHIICADIVILYSASVAIVLRLPSRTQALKHRFYPFAPGVAPEELEQLLLIHAFEDRRVQVDTSFDGKEAP